MRLVTEDMVGVEQQPARTNPPCRLSSGWGGHDGLVPSAWLHQVSKPQAVTDSDPLSGMQPGT